MGNRLFVGNLNFTATEESLREWVEQHGHAVEEVKIMTDRDTGKPRGFGFITLRDAADLSRAIEDLQGQDFMGRPLTVNEAKPRESRGGEGGGGSYRRREPRW
jgi:RNA recognition motif-containing protein